MTQPENSQLATVPGVFGNTVFKPNEIGIFADLPMADYHAAPGLSGSGLDVLQRSPAEFARGERTGPTPDMEFGTLFHSLLLGGNADFYTAPEYYPAPESAKKDAPIIQKAWNWNAGHCQKWREEHRDKPIIPRHGPNSSAWLKAMQIKTEAHPLAKGLISRLTPEVSLFAHHPDFPTLCKGRPDGLILNREGMTIIVEVKTTRDASTAAFSREILKRGYYRKAAWYRMLLHQLKVSPVEYWYIAVEKNDRPRVNIRRLAERAMDKGDLDNDDAMTLFKKCRLGNYWPEFPDSAFPSESDATPLIDLPDYAYGASDDLISGLTETPDEKEAQ